MVMLASKLIMLCVGQPGEYYNKEANIMNDVARFRKAAYTKDLLSSVGKKFLPAPSRHFLFTS